MTKLKNFLIGLMLLSFAAPSLQAQNAPPTDGHSPNNARQRTQEIYSQLNLTEDQKKELEANKQQHRARMGSERQQMRIARQELKEELMKPQLDMARIHQLHGRIKALLSQMEDDRLTSILAVRVILTPDQFAKLISLMEKRRQEQHQ